MSYTFKSLNNTLKVAEYQAIKGDFALTFDVKIPWMQGSKIAARVSRQQSNLTNDEMMAMMMKVTNIYKHEIVDTRA